MRTKRCWTMRHLTTSFRLLIPAVNLGQGRRSCKMPPGNSGGAQSGRQRKAWISTGDVSSITSTCGSPISQKPRLLCRGARGARARVTFETAHFFVTDELFVDRADGPVSRVHLAFQAEGREAVAAFHAAGLAAGGSDNGATGRAGLSSRLLRRFRPRSGRQQYRGGLARAGATLGALGGRDARGSIAAGSVAVRQPPKIRSITSARAKSFSVTPPAEWVDRLHRDAVVAVRPVGVVVELFGGERHPRHEAEGREKLSNVKTRRMALASPSWSSPAGSCSRFRCQ